MLRNKFSDVFHNIQQNASCHQKYRQVLLNLYKEVPFQDFEIELMRIIELLLSISIQPKNPFVDKSLEFIGSFVACVMNDESQAETSTNHAFLENLMTNVINYHNLENLGVRFRCCQLIHLLFSSLGENVLIDSDLWDLITDPLLDRLKDTIPKVRIQAAHALSRFQMPTDPNCKVVSAFLQRLYDVNSSVRKEIVHLIAPTKTTIHKIGERVRDIDYGVRMVAFRKCALIGPKVFTINMRQSILVNGFNERHNLVKQYFLQEMVPSWLNFYNGDYLKFLDALKLDACEDDIKHSEIVCNNVLQLIFKSHQLGTIIENFSLDENKVIPMDKLSYQSTLFWYCLVEYLHGLEDSDEYLELIIPELTLFCAYIERVVDENCKLEGWKYHEYQHNLLQLFKIAKTYDFSDEVGRKCLHKLIIHLLINNKLSDRVLLMIVTILSLMNSNLDVLTSDMCHIISEIIEEPVVEIVQPTENEILEKNYKVAQLKIKLNELHDNSDKAISQREYVEAAKLKDEIALVQKQLDELVSEPTTKQITTKPIYNKVEMTVRKLDILIAVLSLPNLKTLTISLRTIKDEFLPPLYDMENAEVNYRLFKCLCLLCLLDKSIAQQNLKHVCTPLFLYRIIPHENTQNLLISIGTISDILRLYGIDILKTDTLDGSIANKSGLPQHNATRRLYTFDQTEDVESVNNLINSDNIFNILLELLDDEHAVIRNQAGRALSGLVISKITLSPIIISRMILKWLISSVDDKEEVKLQQIIGNALCHLMKVEGGGLIFERAVIPVLSCIGNAPRTSPLADIDICNVVEFLGALTSVESEKQFVSVHRNLAYSLCYQISKKIDDKSVPLYIRMLVSLDLDLNNSFDTVKELIDQVANIARKVTDKFSKKYLDKLLSQLNEKLAESESRIDEAASISKTPGKVNKSCVSNFKSKESNSESRTDEETLVSKTPGINKENCVSNLDSRKSKVNSTPVITSTPITSVTKKVGNEKTKTIEKVRQRKTLSLSLNHNSLANKDLQSSKANNENLQSSKANNENLQSSKANNSITKEQAGESPATRKSLRQANKNVDASPPKDNKKRNRKKKGKKCRSNSNSSSQDLDLHPKKISRLSGDCPSGTTNKSKEISSNKSLRHSETSTPQVEVGCLERLNGKTLPNKLNKNTNSSTPSSIRSSRRLNGKILENKLDSSIDSDSPLSIRCSTRLNGTISGNTPNNIPNRDVLQVKRRKKRGRASNNSVTSIGSKYDDEHQLKAINLSNDNLSISTPTTTPSSSSSSTRRSIRKVIAETTTSSDNELPLRKSARKPKKPRRMDME